MFLEEDKKRSFQNHMLRTRKMFCSFRFLSEVWSSVCGLARYCELSPCVPPVGNFLQSFHYKSDMSGICSPRYSCDSWWWDWSTSLCANISASWYFSHQIFFCPCRRHTVYNLASSNFHILCKDDVVLHTETERPPPRHLSCQGDIRHPLPEQRVS